MKIMIHTFIKTEIDTDTGKSRILQQFSKVQKEYQAPKKEVKELRSVVTEEFE